jgi:hypothetical protein
MTPAHPKLHPACALPAAIYDQTHLDWLVHRATEMEVLDTKARRDMARDIVVSSGGTLIEPRPRWGPVNYELSIAGIVAHGNDLDTAISAWIKAAIRAASPDPAGHST